jgi:phage shock protein PspC (stress-responsive transcriptional regulator)
MNCRICGEDETDLTTLQSPCNCIGSLKYVHTKCISRWRSSSKLSSTYIRCNVCNSAYKDVWFNRYIPLDSTFVRLCFIVLGVFVLYVSTSLLLQYILYTDILASSSKMSDYCPDSTYINDRSETYYRNKTAEELEFLRLHPQHSTVAHWRDLNCKEVLLNFEKLEIALFRTIQTGGYCFRAQHGTYPPYNTNRWFTHTHPGLRYNQMLGVFTFSEKYFLWPFNPCFF